MEATKVAATDEFARMAAVARAVKSGGDAALIAELKSKYGFSDETIRRMNIVARREKALAKAAAKAKS